MDLRCWIFNASGKENTKTKQVFLPSFLPSFFSSFTNQRAAPAHAKLAHARQLCDINAVIASPRAPSPVKPAVVSLAQLLLAALEPSPDSSTDGFRTARSSALGVHVCARAGFNRRPVPPPRRVLAAAVTDVSIT